jgi:hypothetical protein
MLRSEHHELSTVDIEVQQPVGSAAMTSPDARSRTCLRRIREVSGNTTRGSLNRLPGNTLAACPN